MTARYEIFTLRTGATFVLAATRRVASAAVKDLNRPYPAPRYGLRAAASASSRA